MSQDNQKDPIAERLNRHASDQRDNMEAALGEHEIAVQFSRSAKQAGPSEVDKLEAAIAARADSINKDRAETVAEFKYDASRHSVSTLDYRIYLEFFDPKGDPYRVRVVVGWREGISQSRLEPPDIKISKWTLLAGTDDTGFFWECDGKRWKNQEIVDAAFDALANLLRA